MAIFYNGNMHNIQSGKAYSSDELKTMTLDDGTRIVTSPVTDIKRPVCAGIDVHKSILMAAICSTDPETLRAVFYVRQFTTTNRDIRQLAGSKATAYAMSAWNPRANIGFPSMTS